MSKLLTAVLYEVNQDIKGLLVRPKVAVVSLMTSRNICKIYGGGMDKLAGEIQNILDDYEGGVCRCSPIRLEDVQCTDQQ